MRQSVCSERFAGTHHVPVPVLWSRTGVTVELAGLDGDILEGLQQTMQCGLVHDRYLFVGGPGVVRAEKHCHDPSTCSDSIERRSNGLFELQSREGQ